MDPYTSETRPLTPEEALALEKDLTDVLKKHGADMGVIASIQCVKRLENAPTSAESTEEGIPSPFLPNGTDEPNNTGN